MYEHCPIWEGQKGNILESTTPLRRFCRLNRVLHSFLRKVAQKMRQNLPHLLSLLLWQSVKYSIYPTRSTLGEIFGVDFVKNQKNVKNVSKKNLYCIVVWLKKYFFSKTKDEIDYIKCYKTISMPFSWYYISFLNSYNVILDYIYRLLELEL